MNWKSQRSPSQLEINGKLVTKAIEIAKHVNEFFIAKVKRIRDTIVNIPANY